MPNTNTRDALTVSNIRDRINSSPARSAWKRGVIAYANKLLDDLQEGIEGGWVDTGALASTCLLESAMLNGAGSWNQYSWDGFSSATTMTSLPASAAHPS